MNARKQYLFGCHVIVGLLVAMILALSFAPAASAQGVVTISGKAGETVHPGDSFHLIYQVAITNPNSISVTVSEINTVMHLSVSCPNGSSQTISVNAPAESLVIPANNSNWIPSPAQAETTVPSTLCGGNAGVVSAVTFTSSSTVTCNANSAQGCCHNFCTRFTHQRNGVPPPGFSESCKSAKQCTSAQNGGCCKS